jgi:hypothetical protein
MEFGATVQIVVEGRNREAAHRFTRDAKLLRHKSASEVFRRAFYKQGPVSP